MLSSRWTIITIIAALCSIVYELILAQTMATVLGSSVTRYTTTISCYLWALGMGSLAFGFVCKEQNNLLSRLVAVETVLLILGSIAPMWLFFVDSSLQYYSVSIGVRTVAAHIPVIIIGMLSGLELPILLGLARPEQESRILAADFVGTCLGAVAFSLLLYPTLGLTGTAAAAGFLNALIVVACAKPAWKPVSLVLAVAALIIVIFSNEIEPAVIATVFEGYWL